MFKFSMPSPQEMEHIINFCKVMATSPFYQKLGPGGVMAIYMTAKEYDLPFMACLNGGLHTFDGKVTFSAIMIDALILKAGHKTKILHIDDKSCKIRFTRGDRINDTDYQPFEFEYDLKKAATAGYLTKTNWKNSPTDMLYSRCLTGGGRKHIPEVFVGILVAGELVGDNSDSEVTPILPVAVNHQINHHQEVKKLESVPQDGYEEFLDKIGFKNPDEEGTSLKNYVKSIAEKINVSEVHVINSAMKKEESFLAGYEKWKIDRGQPSTNHTNE